MRIHSIRARNLGPFAELKEVRLGPLATIVGQNDVGKSYLLFALNVFMNDKPKLDETHVHQGAAPNADVIIEVAFDGLPASVELEDGVPTTLQEELLTDSNGLLRIRKTYPRANLGKAKMEVVARTFQGEEYRGLPVLKEDGLNKLLAQAGLEAKKSGAGVTNKGKRAALREKVRTLGVAEGEFPVEVPSTAGVYKCIEKTLPAFELFQSDTRLGVGETTFQSQFRPVVMAAAGRPGVVDARDSFTGAIREALQAEVDRIFVKLKQHTDAFAGISAKPEFSWEKAVTLDILGKDSHDIETSFDRRGSGMRRLLMVAFFQYLAEKSAEEGANFIFGVEEPENCLHPRLQRELVASFRRLADEGYQIIVTSHSPVFAGASPVDDLALVVRAGGIAEAKQHPELNLAYVADELGVEPADQICGYDACVFVEGPRDVMFWSRVASTLRGAGQVPKDLEASSVGLAIAGGDNLEHWINLQAMSRLNRRFAVVVDSDRKSAAHDIPGRKLTWKAKVEAQGGKFFILRKRNIENYIHPKALERDGRPSAECDGYTDMKAQFGANVCKLIATMSAEEILEMDEYDDNGTKRHELSEIVQALIALPKG